MLLDEELWDDMPACRRLGWREKKERRGGGGEGDEEDEEVDPRPRETTKDESDQEL